MRLNIALISVLVLAVISCGGHHLTLDPKTKSDKELFDLGVRYLKDNDHDHAREAFKLVFENFPKSDYRILAKIGYADSYYMQGTEANYILAIQEYQDFISLFPFSPKSEYAQYQIGMCYFNMHEKPDRDQTNTRKSLDEFRKVIDNYPKSQYYAKAYDKLISCYTLLAEHEYGIAHYYRRNGRHQAAVDRLKGIIKTYPEKVYQAKYYFDLANSLEKLEQYQESCTYYEELLKKWPNSEYTGDARESRNKTCQSTPTASK